jgi:hypothetical protein
VAALVQAAAGHQRVHVDVAAQVLRPGVQHQREGAGGAQPAGVGGELAQRGRHALHQRAVHPAVIAAGQAVEGVRQREHQVAVRHRQQLRQPGLVSIEEQMQLPSELSSNGEAGLEAQRVARFLAVAFEANAQLAVDLI